MAHGPSALPQLGGDFFLTDGGIETTLIFLEGLELSDFAAFHLLKTKQGEAALRNAACPIEEAAFPAKRDGRLLRRRSSPRGADRAGLCRAVS